jgi:hypothetical protein
MNPIMSDNFECHFRNKVSANAYQWPYSIDLKKVDGHWVLQEISVKQSDISPKTIIQTYLKAREAVKKIDVEQNTNRPHLAYLKDTLEKTKSHSNNTALALKHAIDAHEKTLTKIANLDEEIAQLEKVLANASY